MKRILAMLLATMLMVSALPVSAEEQLTDGVYTASAQGNNGPVEVQVTVQDGKLADVTVLHSVETKGIGTAAFEILTEKMVEVQTPNVDVVTSATLSSVALRLAVTDCLNQAGGVKKLVAQPVEESEPDYAGSTADFVVVGAGGAGIAAAITAAERGLHVILLEKSDIIGGTTVTAAVGVNAGSSPIQKTMTKDMFYQHCIDIGMGAAADGSLAEVSLDYARAFADNGPAMIELLIDCGMELQTDETNMDNAGSHQLVSKENGKFGEVLIEALSKRLAATTADVRTGHKATELVMKDGAVAGVKVTTKKGQEYEISAQNIVLATGGYGTGNSVVSQYWPEADGYTSTECVGGSGDGIVMATQVGAIVSDIDQVALRALAVGYSNLGGAVNIANAPAAGAIVVNAEGRRFANEKAAAAVLTKAIDEQTGKVCYVLLSEEMVNNSPAVADYISKAALKKYDSIDSFAAAMKIDAEALKETVAAYNQSVESGVDAEFGREGMIAFNDGAVYGAKAMPGKHICRGGLVTDGKAQVINEQGEVIEGLYAAGETTYHSNHPVSNAIVFGIVSANQVAEKLGK